MATLVSPPTVPPHLLSSLSLSSSASSTPSTYLKPTFPLPTRTDPTPRIVGLLACQCDPLLEELETEVVACRKVEVNGNAKEGKGGKKGKGGEKKEVKEEWEVELVDTVLFPEGGGQPSDVGTIQPLDLSAPLIPITSVFRRSLTAVHLTSSPLPTGTKVLVKLDASTRRDHMTQHTAQHLLSAVLESPPFNIETLSWGFSPAPSACYVELPREPSPAEILAIEERCNALIREGRPVRIELERMMEGQGLEKREDYVGGVKRTVVIDGVDSNPCCGTHVPSLAFLQAIHVLLTTSTIRGTNVRVYFLAGPRVVEGLRTGLERVRLVGAELGAGSDVVVERVKGALAQAREGRSKEKRLREEIAGYVAESLAERIAKEDAKEGGAKTALLMRDEDATNDVDFLSLVSFKLKELLSSSPSPWLVILACSSSITPQAGGALIVLSSDSAAASVDKAGKEIREKLGGKVKGGGKGRWQGKLAAGETWTSADRATLEEVLRSIA